MGLARPKYGLDNLLAYRAPTFNLQMSTLVSYNYSLLQNPSFKFSDVKTAAPNENKTERKTDLKPEKFMEDVTNRISKALTERKNFTAQPAVNKMIGDFKTQNQNPNFFDSLLLLNLVHKNTLNDALTKTIQNDVFQAHKYLKGYLEGNGEIAETLLKDNNFFKILVFLCDHTFKEFLTPKQYSAFFSQVRDPKTTFKDLVNVFAKKLIFINRNSYTSRTKYIAIDILRSFVTYQVDSQYYNDVPEKLKANNYQLYDEFENNLYSICNIINHALQNNKENPPKFITSINGFLDQMSNISYMTNFSPKLCPLFIEITYLMSGNEKNQMRYGELILKCNEILCANMERLTPERFTRMLFLMSRINIANLNYTAYESFCNNVIEYLNKNIKNFSDEQLKSNFYAIGYHSIMTPPIQAMFDKVLDIEDIKAKSESDKFINYIRNLLASSMNVYALEKGPKLNAIIQFLINDLKAHMPGTKHFDLASMLKIAMILRRAEFNEEFYWTPIFKMISECTREIGEFRFELFYIFNTLEVYRGDAEYAGIMKLVDKFKTAHSHLYKEIMSFDIKSTKDINDTFSMLNHQVDLFLKSYVPTYEKEALSKKNNFLNF